MLGLGRERPWNRQSMPGSVLPDPGTGNLPKFDYTKKKQLEFLTSAQKLKRKTGATIVPTHKEPNYKTE